MQLSIIRQGWKPVSLAIGLIAGNTQNLYADVDQFSNVNAVINNHITSKYLAEISDPAEAQISDKLLFDNLLASWRQNTRFLSSVEDIVNQTDFQAIVSMGTRAVPFIGASIEVQPSTLVWALNFIFNSKISDNPNITVKEACKLWVKELKKHGWML